MFNLIFFIDISEGRPGMLIPLFSSPNTNLPYVQQMDEFFQVRELVPFLEYENYKTAPSEKARSIAINDQGLVAFRSTDNAIVCGDVTEILQYIADNQALVSQDQILRSQLHRIEAAELKPSYEAWRAVAGLTFDDEDQRKFWIDSELQLFQKQKKIWADIDSKDTSAAKGDQGSIYVSISEHSTEYLLRWLSTRSNFVSKDWTKIWHYVNEETPFDERVEEIALSWIYFLGDEDHDLQQTKSVVYVLLERWKAHPKWTEFGEFLSDRLASDPSLLFTFLRPKRLFRGLFGFLSINGEFSDVLKILKFCATEGPKDEETLELLKATMQTLYDRETGRAPDHALLVALSNLYDELID